MKLRLVGRWPRALLAVCLCSWLLLGACSRSQDAPRPIAPILFVGADGLEWTVLRRLFADGKCPNLRGLMERGSFGRMYTLKPTLSPVLWTTIATGKMPDQHGILGFRDADLQQYTSSQRRGRAIWNIADAHGLSSNVFGWWITWPVDELRGVMVSGSASSALIDSNWKPTLMPGVPGQVHPRSLEPEVMAIAERVGSLDAVHRIAQNKIFGRIPAEALGSVEKKLIQETNWSIQSDATYGAIAATIMRTHPADLTLVYFGGTDVSGHRFWRYYEPEVFRWPGDPEVDALWKSMSPDSPPLTEILAKPEGARQLALVIPNYYEWFDEMLGELISAAGPDTTVIVASDHGMHASSTDKPNPKFITGHHQDAIPGVIIAAGPGIARQEKGVQTFVATGELTAYGSVLDVLPTLLALLAIPPAEGAPGKAQVALLDEAARANAQLDAVTTHDAGYRPAAKVTMPSEMNAEFVKRFQALGYLGLDTAADETPRVVDPGGAAPDTTSPIRDDESPR